MGNIMRKSSKTRRNPCAFPSVIEICEPRTLLTTLHPGSEIATIDGTGNNLHHPEWGSTDIELLRLAEADYADGNMPAGADRPSARAISNAVVAAAPEGTLNNRNLTDIVWLWGQFIDHDLDITEGAHPAEPFNIPVPAGDVFFDPFNTGTQVIHLNRSEWVLDQDGVRQQINQITAWLDGSVVYGSDVTRAMELRTLSDGKLKTSTGDLLPFNTAGLPNAPSPDVPTFFLAGDVRANENAALSAMHTLWVREHNRLAEEIAANDPSLSDEEIYQEARAIVRAELQVITYNEFLPALLGAGALSPYRGYKPEVNPGIANEFSTAAYRLGHSLLSPTLLRLDADGIVAPEGNLNLQDAFFRPNEVIDHGIDSILRGATVQLAQELDNQIVDDVRNFLFGPPGAGGFDLASLNIQRGRDHGLSSYNDTREALGLGRVTDFDQISSDSNVVANLMSVYDSVDDIDLWVGGLAEDHVYGSSVGETFQTIIADQFERIRDGDRFWYQNLYRGERLAELESTTLANVIQRNTGISGLQENVFFAPGVLHVDLSAETGVHVTVRASGDALEVLDSRHGRVIASGSLAEIDRLVLVGSNRHPDHFTIHAFPAGSLANGIQILAGSKGGDLLKIIGTNDDDEILVGRNEVSVNGLVIQFEGIDRIVIDPRRGDDDVQISDDVEIPVREHGGPSHHHQAHPKKDLFEKLFGSDDFLEDLIRGRRGR
jgi:peroxidase